MRDLKTNNRRWFYSAMLTLLMFLVSLRYLMQIQLPSEILLLLMYAMIIVGDLNEIIAVCMVCIPLTTVVPHDYVLIVAIVAIAVKAKSIVRINLTFLPVLLLIFLELAHCLNGQFSASQFVVMFAPFTLCVILLWTDLSNINYGFIVRSFAVATCVMCLTLIGMLVVQSGYSLPRAFSNMHRLGLQSEGANAVSLSINPNSLAIMCVLAISGLLQLNVVGCRKRGDYLLIFLMLICGTLTLSRTYLVLLMIMVLLFGFAQRGDPKRIIGFFFVLLVVGSLVIISLSIAFPDVVTQYIGRFHVTDLSGGRSKLFRAYNELIVSDPEILLWGIGLTDYSARIMQLTGLPNIPHNGIQELITAWGLPGLCLIVMFVFCLLFQSRKLSHRIGFIQYIPLIILLAKTQAGQLLKSEYTLLAFSYAYLSLCADLSPKDENRIFTRTQTIPRGSGRNINQLRRKTNK